ncbi:TetR/AcrR family transcriptional regulator C-terminal domain-containing protein [Streptomyces fragilis]|uniref:TetR/AcrR family transcriptional regulator C-terminal domain-containing protein n=1 Tax=Streptomyces fragilis TaxID=67301 RepID=A0ABV2YQ65_9ACTN|nr:TetR/AcrR family transcriptional regulator C-terminal domain-containing protein [Streptomyces fragilis]
MGENAGPRSGRIVAELRQRIESGELAPGERVPSTREITRQWGVAMATATKVLAELRRAGLVRSVPGVGTVVEGGGGPSHPARAARPSAARRPGTRPGAAPRSPGTGAWAGSARSAGSAGRPGAAGVPGPAGSTGGVGPAGSAGGLTLERIVAAAVAVADEEGLAAVSMRRVAAELKVATMSLYRHVADKDDLLTRMLDAAIAGRPLPAERPAHWRAAVELASRQLWGLFRRHPWLAPAMSVTRPQMVTSGMQYSEWILGALHAEGLDLQSAFTAHLTLLNHARGIAVHLESEREAEAHSGLDSEEWMDGQEPALRRVLADGRLPLLSQVAEEGYDLNLDDLFEFGLQRLLDGLALLLGRTPPGRPADDGGPGPSSPGRE